MGIVLPVSTDREESGVPVGVALLVLLNLLAVTLTLALSASPGGGVARLGYVPGELGLGRLLLSSFLHAGFWPFFLTMAFLIAVGPAVEDRLGTMAFLWGFLALGIGHVLVYGIAVRVFFPAQAALAYPGAMGAVCAVIGAFVGLHPGWRVNFDYLFWCIATVARGRFRLGAGWAMGFLSAAYFVWAFLFSEVGSLGRLSYWIHFLPFAGGVLLGRTVRLVSAEQRQEEMERASPSCSSGSLPIIRIRADDFLSVSEPSFPMRRRRRNVVSRPRQETPPPRIVQRPACKARIVAPRWGSGRAEGAA